MTDAYQHFHVFFQIAINTVFVSIPEELFLVLFTLAFTGDLCFLRTKTPGQKRIGRDDFGRIAICTIVPAIASNVLRYIGFDFIFIFSGTMLSIYILVFIVYDYRNHVKGAIKAAIALMLGILISLIIEMSYIPLLLYITGKTVVYFNSNMLLNIATSLPARFIQFIILTFIIIKQYTFVKARFIKPLFENTTLTVITLVTVIFNIIFMVLFCNLIGYNKILEGINGDIGVAITVGIILFPIINISSLILGIYYKEYQVQVLRDKLENLDSAAFCADSPSSKSTKVTYLRRG